LDLDPLSVHLSRPDVLRLLTEYIDALQPYQLPSPDGMVLTLMKSAFRPVDGRVRVDIYSEDPVIAEWPPRTQGDCLVFQVLAAGPAGAIIHTTIKDLPLAPSISTAATENRAVEAALRRYAEDAHRAVRYADRGTADSVVTFALARWPGYVRSGLDAVFREHGISEEVATYSMTVQGGANCHLHVRLMDRRRLAEFRRLLQHISDLWTEARDPVARFFEEHPVDGQGSIDGDHHRSVLLYVAGSIEDCFEVIRASELPKLKTDNGYFLAPGLSGTGGNRDAHWKMSFAFAPPDERSVRRIDGFAIDCFGLSPTRTILELACLEPLLTPRFALLLEIIQSNLVTADSLEKLADLEQQIEPRMKIDRTMHRDINRGSPSDQDETADLGVAMAIGGSVNSSPDAKERAASDTLGPVTDDELKEALASVSITSPRLFEVLKAYRESETVKEATRIVSVSSDTIDKRVSETRLKLKKEFGAEHAERLLPYKRHGFKEGR